MNFTLKLKQAGNNLTIEMNPNLDVTIVVRGAHERTEGLAISLACKQVPSQQVFVIHEVPFSQAVKKTFEIGIEENKYWTLAVDADLLLTEYAVQKMIVKASTLPANFFIYQGQVLDKLFCKSRRGGPHLYRTSHLKLAHSLVEEKANLLRPESAIYQIMAEQGYHYYHDVIVYAAHDYEQYLRDIYRKAFIHAIKHRNRIKDLMQNWMGHVNDLDYQAALIGALASTFYSGDVYASIDFFNGEEIYRHLSAFGLEEKKPLNDINDILLSEILIPELVGLVGNFEGQVKRSDKPDKNQSIGIKTLIYAGRKIEYFGKKIRTGFKSRNIKYFIL